MDYIFILLMWVVLLVFVKGCKKSYCGNCCGDCVSFTKCFSEQAWEDRNSFECPACADYKEAVKN